MCVCVRVCARDQAMSRVPEEERMRIVELSLKQYSKREISRITNRPLKTVNRIIQAYRTERTIKDAPQKARPKVTTEDEDMSIILAVNDFLASTVRELATNCGGVGCIGHNRKTTRTFSGSQKQESRPKADCERGQQRETACVCPGTRALE